MDIGSELDSLERRQLPSMDERINTNGTQDVICLFGGFCQVHRRTIAGHDETPNYVIFRTESMRF